MDLFNGCLMLEYHSHPGCAHGPTDMYLKLSIVT